MAQLGSSIINGSLSVTGRVNLADYLYGNVCGNLCGTATNATCFGGCTFTQACTTIRSGLTSCTGTVTQVKIGDTAYDPTSGVISLPEYPSVSTVNNNKITIQKNSTAVGSFTLNQNSDCSINISVPTKVSELTNDSGFTTCKGTVTIADKAKTNANTPIALCSGATTVGKSSGCSLTFNTSTGVLCAKCFSGDIDSSKLSCNAINTAGIVPAPTSSNANKVWGTDASGNPSWMSVGGGTVTIADKASANANTPVALCSGTTTVGKSSGCSLTFNTSRGVLSMDTLSATNVCGSIHGCNYSESSGVYNWMISCSCCDACNYLCSYGGGTWVSNSLISCNTCCCAYNCIFAYSCCGCANNTIRSWSCSNASSSYNELCACGCNAGYNTIRSCGCCSAYTIISSNGLCCYANNYICSSSHNSAGNVIWSDSWNGNACNVLYSEGKCGAINEFTSKCFNCDADFKYYTICQTYNKINFDYYCNDVFHCLASHYICYDGTTDLIPNCAIHAGSISSHTLTL